MSRDDYAKREAARQLRMAEAKRHAEEEKANPQKKEKKQPVVEKKKAANPTNENGRVGERPYARGRSFVEDRYDK